MPSRPLMSRNVWFLAPCVRHAQAYAMPMLLKQNQLPGAKIFPNGFRHVIVFFWCPAAQPQGPHGTWNPCLAISTLWSLKLFFPWFPLQPGPDDVMWFGEVMSSSQWHHHTLYDGFGRGSSQRYCMSGCIVGCSDVKAVLGFVLLSQVDFLDGFGWGWVLRTNTESGICEVVSASNHDLFWVWKFKADVSDVGQHVVLTVHSFWSPQRCRRLYVSNPCDGARRGCNVPPSDLADCRSCRPRPSRSGAHMFAERHWWAGPEAAGKFGGGQVLLHRTLAQWRLAIGQPHRQSGADHATGDE